MAPEKAAILATTITETVNYRNYSLASVNGEYFFFLSAEEAGTLFADDDDRRAMSTDSNREADWWLRSPREGYPDCAGWIGYGSTLSHMLVYSDSGARPAFNLDLTCVLFYSAAEGGKSPASGGLYPIENGSNTDWKLTLLDSDRTFAA